MHQFHSYGLEISACMALQLYEPLHRVSVAQRTLKICPVTESPTLGWGGRVSVVRVHGPSQDSDLGPLKGSLVGAHVCLCLWSP